MQKTDDTYIDIIGRCREGERSAQMSFYALFHRGVYNSSLRIVGNSAEAEEVMQETLLKALMCNELLIDNRQAMEAMLRRIAINRSIDVCRKRRVRFAEIDHSAGEWDEEQGGAEDEAPGGLSAEKIFATMELLPKGSRIILTLKLIEGYQYCEIAKELGIAESAVRSQFSRGRKRLVELLKSER